MSETPPSADLKAPIALWRAARMFLCNLHLAWQNPEDIAARGYVSRKIHALIASWIRVAEVLMRHMLLIEASFIAPPPAKARSRGGQRTRRLVEFLPDRPDDWRVCFHCTLAERRLPAGTPAQRTPASQAKTQGRLEAGAPLHHRILSVWPLALRYEAVLRVFNDPIPYARRLARRLHARPQLAQALLRAPPEYVNRVDYAADITQAAERAWPPPTPDSS
jgi:hypothetical protein